MNYRIVQYIQPWEIDSFERQVNQLIKSSYSIEHPKNIILDVTMNLDIVDWNLSKLPRKYFVNKFDALKRRANVHFTVEFDMDSQIRGAADKRRSIQYKQQDFIIWLDSDIFFPTSLLPYMIMATTNIEANDYIVTPQLIRYWDSSWDVLTNEKYLTEPFNHRDYFDSFSLDNECVNNETTININQRIKFGGGWFNLFTDSIFKKIPLPLELGPYGHDDTYVTYCASVLQIPQYILTGQIVTEVGKLYDVDYIKPLLHVTIADKQKITDFEFTQLIKRFK